MTLWLLMTGLMIATAAIAVMPLVRRRRVPVGGEADVYRAQLQEIEREELAGLVAPDDAQLARLEIQRRLLGAAEPAETGKAESMNLSDRVTLIAVVAAVAIGSILIYGTVGRPGIPSAVRSGGTPITANVPAEGGAAMSLPAVDEMISKLEARLKDNPKDAEGWRMLGWSRYRTEDYAGAAKAYAEAVKYAPADADTQSAYGEALTRAAGGLVTPEAVAALQACLKLDKSNPRARFLLGLKLEQDGKPAAALDAWLTLLKEAKPDDDWFEDVRGRVVELAESSGIDVSKRLPPARKPAGPASTTMPGPNASDVAAASAMPAEDRQVMIENMVSRLDARLRQNPGDLDGWLKLIQARRVLGQTDLASDAVARGRKAFSKDAAAQARLAEAATAPLSPP